MESPSILALYRTSFVIHRPSTSQTIHHPIEQVDSWKSSFNTLLIQKSFHSHESKWDCNRELRAGIAVFLKVREEPPLEANPDYNGKTWTQPHRTFGNHLYLNWSKLAILQFEMMRVSLDLWLSKGVDGLPSHETLENLHVDEPDHIEIVLLSLD
ncbi:aamy domain-containing protein [Caerostris extrusa]|uniref:Aamy domain-containing protein n=1 Tax=Caerostris extrusa TaxID=172846 RepID=A0AAV4YE64_CAEEX|nr:aamy domain-containing protein [Caerostris extrusa]